MSDDPRELVRRRDALAELDWQALRRRRQATWEAPVPLLTSGLTWLPEKYLLVDCETGDVWGFEAVTPDLPTLPPRARTVRATLLPAAFARLVGLLGRNLVGE